MSEFLWQFPRNDSNETEGPNDGGISHFTSNRLGNVIRESIQNSLDARTDISKPVRVDIALTTLTKGSFATDSLQQSLLAAANSPHNDQAHSRQFKKGRNLVLQNGGIKTLRITDSNTTGADDIPRKGNAPSKWESLTKSTGLSVKDQPDAAGSFGLGKHAPFALTSLRTILYSTAWEADGKLRRRFQGKTILVSHEDSKAIKRRKTGYLGDGYEALSDDGVPEDFRLNEPGLSLFLPGYEPEDGWIETSVRTVINNFFHAIVHGGLEAEVDGQAVDSFTLNKYQVSRRTTDFIRVSQTEPVAETEILDIGRITLRLSVGDRPGKRQIALVRDAGMMISDNPREMKLVGLGRIPTHWQEFTAIIECLSEGKPSVLRESESPSHSSISTDQISDRARRNRANSALRELGHWCRDRIKELAEPRPSDSVENATAIARYLPIEDEEGASSDAQVGINQEVVITVPQQTRQAPRGNYARQGRRAPGSVPGGGGNGGGGGGGRQRRTGGRRGGTPREIPSAFTGVRFRPGTRRPTHSLVVTFDKPPDTLRNIQLMASVEDGRDELIGISEAYFGSRKLSVKHNKIASLPAGSSDRCSIEFVTQVPVSNKTYYIMHGG